MANDEVVVDEGSSGDQRLAGMLFALGARDDPYPLYRTVNIPGCRHAPALAILKDPRLGPPAVDARSDEVMWTTFARWLINLDGERHQRMRHHFSRVFTPHRVEQYRPTVQHCANGLIDAVRDAGRMDLVADFARPLPFSIIATVLGVPEDDQDWLAQQMLVLHTGFARQHDPESVAAASAAIAAMLDFFAALLDERAAQPRDDLLSILATDVSHDEEEHADLLANCMFFIEAGHNTTSSLITGAVALLLAHPDQLARLQDDPSLVPFAIEEALRMVSPLSVVVCRAREDLNIDGYDFVAGEQRLIFPPGANRDPDAFDDPDTFDVTRGPNTHIAFSAGTHFCLGAPLARLHGEVAIQTLMDRLPDLRSVAPPEWLASMPLRMPQRFDVAW